MADEFVDYVEVFQGEDKQWYFHAKSNNGEVLSSSEGYKYKAVAKTTAATMFPDKRLFVEGEEPQRHLVMPIELDPERRDK